MFIISDFWLEEDDFSGQKARSIVSNVVEVSVLNGNFSLKVEDKNHFSLSIKKKCSSHCTRSKMSPENRNYKKLGLYPDTFQLH